MQRKFLPLTWADFDAAIKALVPHAAPFASGIYGVARGGLPLAVALSHRTGLPILTKPDPDMVWVDDIVDSGQTLLAYKEAYPKALYLAWVARGLGRAGVRAAHIVPDGKWVIFPWEDIFRAQEEARSYALSRQ